MRKKTSKRLAGDIRASLHEALDHTAGKRTRAIVHRATPRDTDAREARRKLGLIMRKKKTLPAHDVGSGNIFADLGLPNAEEHQLKAALVVQLYRLIKVRKLTQTAAAKLTGIKQPDLSNILRGHFQGFSVERLMRMLTAFDQDIEITVRPRRRKTGEAGRITFSAAPV